MHEDFRREVAVEGSSDRTFGLVIAAALGVAALAPLLRAGHEIVRWWLLGLGLLFAAVALVRPGWLAPLNRLWLYLGLLLSRTVSPIALALIYYTTVVPVGYVMRWTGGDSLKLRFDSTAASYWVHRDPPGPPPETMKNQF